MPRWSTTGVAQFVKLVLVPVFGLVVVALEQQRDTPRGLILGVGLVLIGVFPGSLLQVALLGRRAPDPPGPPSESSAPAESGPST